MLKYFMTGNDSEMTASERARFLRMCSLACLLGCILCWSLALFSFKYGDGAVTIFCLLIGAALAGYVVIYMADSIAAMHTAYPGDAGNAGVQVEEDAVQVEDDDAPAQPDTSGVVKVLEPPDYVYFTKLESFLSNVILHNQISRADWISKGWTVADYQTYSAILHRAGVLISQGQGRVPFVQSGTLDDAWAAINNFYGLDLRALIEASRPIRAAGKHVSGTAGLIAR